MIDIEKTSRPFFFVPTLYGEYGGAICGVSGKVPCNTDAILSVTSEDPHPEDPHYSRIVESMATITSVPTHCQCQAIKRLPLALSICLRVCLIASVRNDVGFIMGAVSDALIFHDELHHHA